MSLLTRNLALLDVSFTVSFGIEQEAYLFFFCDHIICVSLQNKTMMKS